VTTNHSYSRAGTYRVTAQVTDGAGNSAFIQMVMVVNGPVGGAATSSKIDPTILISAWPIYGLTCFIVLVFYLGERRELHNLRKKHQLISSF
jgi:hypothetical protein